MLESAYRGRGQHIRGRPPFTPSFVPQSMQPHNHALYSPGGARKDAAAASAPSAKFFDQHTRIVIKITVRCTTPRTTHDYGSIYEKGQHSRHTAPVDDIRDRGQPCSSSHQDRWSALGQHVPLSISEDSWRPRPQAPLEAAAADLSAASALSTQAGRGSEGRRAAPSASARRRSSPSSAPLMRSTSSCSRTVAACSCSETRLLHLRRERARQ